MYKVVILGCENSHADLFLGFVENNPEFADVQVVGVYTDELEEAKKLNDKYGVKIMEAYDEFVGEVDGVVVTARDGKNHLKYIKPYLPSGVPVFVDKPIATSIEEAEEMMADFKKYNNKYTGGSVIGYCGTVQRMKQKMIEDGEKTISGVIRAPIMMNSEYSGLYFYAEHLVEVLCEMFGRFPKSVRAVRNEECVTAIFRYDAYDITGVFTDKDPTSYYALRMCRKKNYGEDILFEMADFEDEFRRFHKLLRDEGTVMDSKEFIAPVYIMSTLAKAIESGEEERIPW